MHFPGVGVAGSSEVGSDPTPSDYVAGLFPPCSPLGQTVRLFPSPSAYRPRDSEVGTYLPEIGSEPDVLEILILNAAELHQGRSLSLPLFPASNEPAGY